MVKRPQENQIESKFLQGIKRKNKKGKKQQTFEKTRKKTITKMITTNNISSRTICAA